MSLDRAALYRTRGSALLLALFVIVVMGLLAATMGRFLRDSGEKNVLEVRSVRALLAAQSGLEITLYRLFPNKTLAQPAPLNVCESSRTITFTSEPGLIGCYVVVSCLPLSMNYNGMAMTSYRLVSQGGCGVDDLTGVNADFTVSRTVVAQAYDGGPL